jgi:hypothetical protein
VSDHPDRRAGDRAHVTEIGSDLAARVASASSCCCGWAKVITFARPSGEPVALRLAQAEAERHDRDPGPAGRRIVLVTDDADVFAAVLAIDLPGHVALRVHRDVPAAAGAGYLPDADLVLLGPDALLDAARRSLEHPQLAAVTTDPGRPRPAAVLAALAGCARLVLLPRDGTLIAAVAGTATTSPRSDRGQS